MEVMAAGMGCRAGGTGEGLAAEFRHGQCVHICPEENGLAALANFSHYAVTALLGLQTCLGQFFHHIGNCLGKIQADLSILMKITAVCNGFILEFQSSFIIIHVAVLLSITVL